MPGFEGYTAATTLGDSDLLLKLEDPAGTKLTKSITAANVRKSFSPFVNVKDYGAKGDGTTDDTAAVQAWANYIVTNGRCGSVPNGIYRLTSKINFQALPGWGIVGETKLGAVFRQDTVTAPHFDLGATAGTALHSFKLDNLSFFRPAGVTVSNTNAIALLFNTEAYHGSFTNLYFDNGFDGMYVTSGVACPWGCSFDNLDFGGSMVGHAMDWSQGVNAVPNNHFGRMSVDTSGYTISPVIDMRGYNCFIGTLEFFGNLRGITGLRWNSTGMLTMGTVKFEGITNTGSGFAFLDFLGASKVDIGHISVGGFTCVLTPSSGITRLLETGAGSPNGYVRLADAVVRASSLSGQVVICGGSTGSRVEIGHVEMFNGWTLQSTGSATSSDVVSVSTWNNGQLSADKGNADYTVAVGDPNLVIFQTPFTAQRTVTLPAKGGNNLFTGLKYEFVFNGAINGVNNVVIKEGGNTLDTFKADKFRAVYTYRRNLWVLTAYGALGPDGRTTVNDADYSVLTSDQYVAVTAITATRTLTLPAASSVNAGQRLTIKDESGSVSSTVNLAVTRSGSDTIDGQTSVTFTSARCWMTLESDGASKWAIIARSMLVDKQAYTSGSNTWTRPWFATANAVTNIDISGGGGGGGAGRRGAAATARVGGGGGAGGGRSLATFPTSDLPSTLTVVVGAGGAGGAAQTVDSTDGASGGAGSNTTVAGTGISLAGAGGGGGAGGASGGGGGGGTSPGAIASAGAGGSGASNGAAGSTASNGSGYYGGSGGAAGAGIGANDAVSNGAAGRTSPFWGGSTAGTAGTSGGNGGNATAPTNTYGAGASGGSGASSIIGVSGSAGTSSGYGTGGSGGAASLNGNSSGAGAAGTGGIAIITTQG